MGSSFVSAFSHLSGAPDSHWTTGFVACRTSDVLSLVAATSAQKCLFGLTKKTAWSLPVRKMVLNKLQAGISVQLHFCSVITLWLTHTSLYLFGGQAKLKK